ncbi:MAG TPA: succinate dehydrogenase [Rhabdochlamydiaceae bacterium]|nr:succinate dehydrogenase [Rhabdochlamydiaceae bacterium]
MSSTTTTLPSAFIWRRLHSLMGLWLVLFLIEHLLVNSQAALLLGDSGRGFVELVNGIHNLPYLQVIEVTLLGIPILIHGIWGIKYLLTGKFNSSKTNGSAPSLNYGRNHAYTWQRITSWILLFLLTFHIVKFRFVDYPGSVHVGGKNNYFAPVTVDNGLYTVADRIGAKIYSVDEVERMRLEAEASVEDSQLLEVAGELREKPGNEYDEQKKIVLNSAQNLESKLQFSTALSSKNLKPNEVMAVADNFATVSLLIVRDTFKSPIYVALYTVFVLATCFHAFNGFWTFLITWGWILKMSSQKAMVKVAVGMMVIIAFLGLIAVWGTYWLNLKY